jgi:hypothetical protein
MPTHPDGRSPVDWTFVFQKATDRYTINSGMTHAKKALVDGALILMGAGITILFVSTDGNGQNPVPWQDRRWWLFWSMVWFHF